MLEAILYGKMGTQGGCMLVDKFRHDGKVSYEVDINADLDEAEMNELIDGLIAMREGSTSEPTLALCDPLAQPRLASETAQAG